MSKPNGPLRVAFIGQPGAGKTTQARLLQAKYKGDVLSFASPLKKLTRELFGEQMDDPGFARTANQQVGMAVRHTDINTWVRLLLAKVPDSRNSYVDDLRFFNEYAALRRLGFHFIRLSCLPSVLHERRSAMSVEQFQHESEQEAAQLPAEFLVRTDEISPEEAHNAIVAYLEAKVIPVLGHSEEQPDARPDDIPYISIQGA